MYVCSTIRLCSLLFSESSMRFTFCEGTLSRSKPTERRGDHTRITPGGPPLGALTLGACPRAGSGRAARAERGRGRAPERGEADEAQEPLVVGAADRVADEDAKVVELGDAAVRLAVM